MRRRGLLSAAVTALLLLAPTSALAQPSTWNFTQATVPGAQAAGGSGAGITVAIVDTWVDGRHPQLGGRALAGVDCSSGTCLDGQRPDDCEHGTHVAGTIGSTDFGVAPRARILPVQVLVSDGSGGCSGALTAVAAGIDYAAGHGAQVINLSLAGLVPGLSNNSAVTDAVDRAAAAGIIVVFAAGNSSLPLADSYGGSAVIVAATGPSGGLASYSQRGVGVTLAAPGGSANGTCTEATCVLSLLPRDRYGLLQGTSMAAPHVAGIAALLLAQAPGRGAADVRQTLTGTAHPLLGAGSGLVDATAALAVRGGAPAARPDGPTPASTTAPPASTAPAAPPADSGPTASGTDTESSGTSSDPGAGSAADTGSPVGTGASGSPVGTGASGPAGSSPVPSTPGVDPSSAAPSRAASSPDTEITSDAPSTDGGTAASGSRGGAEVASGGLAGAAGDVDAPSKGLLALAAALTTGVGLAAGAALRGRTG